MKKLIRINFFIFIILLSTQGCGEGPTSSPEPVTLEYEGIIVAVGDSLTEGLGVAEEFAYPSILEKKAARPGLPVSGRQRRNQRRNIQWNSFTNQMDFNLETGYRHSGHRRQ